MDCETCFYLKNYFFYESESFFQELIKSHCEYANIGDLQHHSSHCVFCFLGGRAKMDTPYLGRQTSGKNILRKAAFFCALKKMQCFWWFFYFADTK
jgi:hypothetical protein